MCCEHITINITAIKCVHGGAGIIKQQDQSTTCQKINFSSNRSLEQTGFRDRFYEVHSVKYFMHFIVCFLKLNFHEFHLAARHMPSSFLLDRKAELKDSTIYHRACKK